MRSLAAFTVVLFLGIPLVRAAEETPITNPAAEENIQVTATRFPEDSENLPTVVTVLDGAMLRERGITDLKSLLIGGFFRFIHAEGAFKRWGKNFVDLTKVPAA